MSDIKPAEMKLSKDNFNGICKTGINASLAVAYGEMDKVPLSVLLYYVQSVPGTTGRVSKDNLMVKSFQEACDAWTEVTGIKFIKVASKSEAYHFIIRTANADEEKENINEVAHFFFGVLVEVEIVRLSR